jgi:splicing suppressor protein 51
MLATKCPIFLTGFDENDMMRDVAVMEEEHKEDLDWVLRPRENVFRSLKRDVNLMDVRDGIYSNWGIWGVRGKRYEVQNKDL